MGNPRGHSCRNRLGTLSRCAILTIILLAGTFDPGAAQYRGPSTAADPYLVPSLAGVQTIALLTVGESPAENTYRMVGIPDGLGAFRTGRTFTLLMNHELSGASGSVRAHGRKGAFVSRWTIDRKTLEVLRGEDHTPSADKVFLWDGPSGSYTRGTTVWERLCSADLAAQSAFFYAGRGTGDRIYLTGEEVDEGRAWGRIVTGPHTGEAWQLPRLGRMPFENAVASPYPQRKTVGMLLDDANLDDSEVYVYVGSKERRGHPVERAGLTNGKFYGVKVFRKDGTPVIQESNEFGLGDAATGYVGTARFELVNLGNNGDVSGLTASQIEQASVAANVLRMQRVEDGAWDPRRRHADDFYFVTTASISGNSRLWRLRFDDIEHPEKGGQIEIILKGDEGRRMFDNMTIDRCGRILLQEDPGGNARLAKVWLYAIETGNFREVAHHDPKFFGPPSGTFLTANEESSGIIDAEEILGKGWFLLDVQAHFSTGTELVEGGQLLAMRVDRAIECDRQQGEDEEEDDDERPIAC